MPGCNRGARGARKSQLIPRETGDRLAESDNRVKRAGLRPWRHAYRDTGRLRVRYEKIACNRYWRRGGIPVARGILSGIFRDVE